MRNNIFKNEKGFSLIETLIAVSILMIAIAGPLSLVQAGLFSSNHERNLVSATYLAQEALEFVKNLRDANSYSQYTAALDENATVKYWLEINGQSLTDMCGAGCYVDPYGNLDTTGRTYIEPALAEKSLNRNAQGSYTYVSGTPTNFTRKLFVSSVGTGGDEALVTVQMGWKDGNLDRTYYVSEIIYNYAQ